MPPRRKRRKTKSRAELRDGKRPNLRVSLDFYVAADKDLKIIEGSVTWFKDVLKARDEYGLDKWLFEIERHGAAGDPK